MMGTLTKEGIVEKVFGHGLSFEGRVLCVVWRLWCLRFLDLTFLLLRLHKYLLSSIKQESHNINKFQNIKISKLSKLFEKVILYYNLSLTELLTCLKSLIFSNKFKLKQLRTREPFFRIFIQNMIDKLLKFLWGLLITWECNLISHLNDKIILTIL